jgi:hypothetical protein
MAYEPTQLRLLVPTMDGSTGTPQVWSLQGVDAVTVVRANNFISDANRRGMRKGDLVFYTLYDNIATKATVTGFHIFVVLVINASGTADLTDGTAITITNT